MHTKTKKNLPERVTVLTEYPPVNDPAPGNKVRATFFYFFAEGPKKSPPHSCGLPRTMKSYERFFEVIPPVTRLARPPGISVSRMAQRKSRARLCRRKRSAFVFMFFFWGCRLPVHDIMPFSSCCKSRAKKGVAKGPPPPAIRRLQEKTTLKQLIKK